MFFFWDYNMHLLYGYKRKEVVLRDENIKEHHLHVYLKG